MSGLSATFTLLAFIVSVHGAVDTEQECTTPGACEPSAVPSDSLLVRRLETINEKKIKLHAGGAQDDLPQAVEAEIKALEKMCHRKLDASCSWYWWCPSGSSCNNGGCECDAGHCTVDKHTCVSEASLDSPEPDTVQWPLSVLVEGITTDAIAKFLSHKEEYVGAFCGDDDNVDMSSMVESISWPGCSGIESIADFDNKCTGTCIQTSTMKDVDDFNTQHAGTKVSYNSRSGQGENGAAIEQVSLTGWWLPAPGHNSNTPRIVVQHGHTSNGNKFRTQFVAFQLRKLGYSVLVNNLRDHCYSDDSEAGIVEWGHAYPFDVLGAWDYLQTDPNGTLGGALDASKVGILGFSMGALLTTTAFGMEARVPAVWVDGPPLSPDHAFKFGAFNHLKDSYMLPEWLAQKTTEIIAPPVWKNVVDKALESGVDITEYTPEKTLPTGPATQRRIMVTANKHDSTVSYEDGRTLIQMLNEHPSKYKVSELTFIEECNGNAHCVDHVRESDFYSTEMCKFWSGVFGEGKDCGEAKVCNTRTEGTCKYIGCFWWRGKTFCDDESVCRCRKGYCSDGETCAEQE